MLGKAIFRPPLVYIKEVGTTDDIILNQTGNTFLIIPADNFQSRRRTTKSAHQRFGIDHNGFRADDLIFVSVSIYPVNVRKAIDVIH